MTQIIDGKAIAAGVRRDVAADVAAFSSAQTRKHSASLYPLPVSSWIEARRPRIVC